MGDMLDPLLTGRAGTRVNWSSVPLRLRLDFEARLGSSVASAVTADTGFSPALAARLELVDGRYVFVKALGPDQLTGAPGGQDSYRREARITAELPAAVPAPRLLSTWENSGWVVLVFEAIQGHPPRMPWRADELERVLEGMGRLAEVLTPAPIDAPAVSLPGGRHWQALHKAAPGQERLDWLDPWAIDNIDRLMELETAFDRAAAGSTLAHTDIRADNVLLTTDGAVFVDWPHAKVGRAWIDLLYFLPSVAMQGGPDPNGVFWAHPISHGANEQAVVTVLAGIAGFFVHSASLPAPPGLPTLRRFQAAQGQQAVHWLRQLIN